MGKNVSRKLKKQNKQIRKLKNRISKRFLPVIACDIIEFSKGSRFMETFFDF